MFAHLGMSFWTPWSGVTGWLWAADVGAENRTPVLRKSNIGLTTRPSFQLWQLGINFNILSQQKNLPNRQEAATFSILGSDYLIALGFPNPFTFLSSALNLLGQSISDFLDFWAPAPPEHRGVNATDYERDLAPDTVARLGNLYNISSR